MIDFKYSRLRLVGLWPKSQKVVNLDKNHPETGVLCYNKTSNQPLSMENNTEKNIDLGGRKITKRLIVIFSITVTAAIVVFAANSWRQDKALPKDGQKNAETPKKKSKNPYVVPHAVLKPQINLEKIEVEWAPKLVKAQEGCSQEDGEECFLAGKITNDDSAYEGKSVYIEAVRGDMGFGFSLSGMNSTIRHYITEKDESGTEKKFYAQGETSTDEDDVAISGITDISGEIVFPDTNYKLKKHSEPGYFFSEVKAKKKVFTDKGLGDFYLTKDGCQVVELPDHTAVAYDFAIPFAPEDDIPKYSPLDVVFNDGEKNADQYRWINPTCGELCDFLEYAGTEYFQSENELEIAGKDSGGEEIYRYKNPKNSNLLALYNDKNTWPYFDEEMSNLKKNKYTYEEFIESSPYLFWKDPLGRWIVFINRKFDWPQDTC